MRYQQILLGFIFFLFLLCAFITLSFAQKTYLTSGLRTEEIEEVIQSFKMNTGAVTEINLNSMYLNGGKLELLNPLLGIENQAWEYQKSNCSVSATRQDNNFEQPVVERINYSRPRISNQKDSLKSVFDESLLTAQTKTRRLKAALDGGNHALGSFLLTRPLVDENGRSYALWLVNSGVAPFSEKDWIEKHLSYFLVTELKGILESFEIRNPAYSTLAQLSKGEVDELIKGSELVLTSNYLFLRDKPRLGFSPLSFLVYRTSEFQDHLTNFGGQLDLKRESSEIFCLLKIGNACWTYSANHFVGFLFRYSLLILIAVGLILILFLFSYIKRLRGHQSEQNRRRLALQVLSHEFRTPVASLLLKIEQANEFSCGFNQEIQNLFTLISRDVYRLQRIIEFSKIYLQAEGNRLHLNFSRIDSANEWLADFISDLDPELRREILIQDLASDQPFFADVFWLKFVLNNLVQNAIAHGKAPFLIRLALVKDKLRISVEDQGHCEFESIDQMTEPFVKSTRSKGMGLGLNIAQHIVKEWGGRLCYSSHPTAFSFELKTPD